MNCNRLIELASYQEDYDVPDPEEPVTRGTRGRRGKERKREQWIRPERPKIIPLILYDDIKTSLLTAPMIIYLKALYSEPTRHYHTLSHVRRLLKHLDEDPRSFYDLPAVEAAIWFQNAIYDTRVTRHDNKRKSARLAVQMLTDAGVQRTRVGRIKQMIEATATHRIPTHILSIAGFRPQRTRAVEPANGDIPGTETFVPRELDPEQEYAEDLAGFLDLDLGIFGSREEEYDKYEESLRKEHAWMDNRTYRKKRREELRTLVGSSSLDSRVWDHIFYTRHFRYLYDSRARDNILRALLAIEGLGGKFEA